MACDMTYMMCEMTYMMREMTYMICEMTHVMYEMKYMLCEMTHMVCEMTYIFLGDRPVRKLHLHETDLEVKQPRGICKARCNALQGSLALCVESRVVHEEKVHDRPLLGHGVGTKATLIEESAIKMVPDIHPIVITQITSHLLEHHAGEDAEESVPGHNPASASVLHHGVQPTD